LHPGAGIVQYNPIVWRSALCQYGGAFFVRGHSGQDGYICISWDRGLAGEPHSRGKLVIGKVDKLDISGRGDPGTWLDYDPAFAAYASACAGRIQRTPARL